MVGNTHRANCANAQKPGCRCSGCGGAEHGWQGWTALAKDPPPERYQRRRELEDDVEMDKRGAPSFNARNRLTYLHLARLDIADHLWATNSRPKVDGRVQPNPPAEKLPAVSSDLGQMDNLTDEIMVAAWKDISDDIDKLVESKPAAREIKKNLANHSWCSLLVALIQLIEKVNKTIDLFADTAKRFAKDVLSGRFTSTIFQPFRDAVVTIVVDRVWSALTRLLEAHFPLIGGDTLRVLRMLTVFTCPSVDRHRDVYEHAVVPLMGDARGLVAEDVKTQVIALFTAWWQRRSPDPAG